ncbi:MAG: tetratricopeptide repeat protein, partial [Syntrophomonadaceae bacterium]|nr:tetratricopeptide repeat protein [Syntrophomonadaceae bacterium]
MITRRSLFPLVLLLAVSLLLPGNPVQAAGEWARYNQAIALYQQGNYQEAVPVLEELVYDMQRIGQNEAAGFCAQYLGKIMDKWGRYEEAVKYYRLEAELWDPLGHQDWTLTDKRRAETINPEIQLFVEKPAGAGNTSGKFEPANGAIIGTSILRDPAVNGDFNRAEQVYGRSFSGILAYVLWGDLPSAVPEVAEAEKAGVALQLAWQPNQGLQAVQDNQYMHQFIQELSELSVPVFLRFGGEMNGDWTPWSGNPELYKE